MSWHLRDGGRTLVCTRIGQVDSVFLLECYYKKTFPSLIRQLFCDLIKNVSKNALFQTRAILCLNPLIHRPRQPQNRRMKSFETASEKKADLIDRLLMNCLTFSLACMLTYMLINLDCEL